MQRAGRWIVLAVLAVVAPMGCASSPWLKVDKLGYTHASETNPVVRILAAWQLGEGQAADGKTVRGFVGQIFLLDAEKQVPVIAQGSVRIYLFDDQGTPAERDTPIHQHDFPEDSWKVRLQKTKMGPAYVVFTPYVRGGTHKSECSLRIKFMPHDGSPPVFSDLAHVTLPGTTSKAVDPVLSTASQTSSSQVTTAGASEPATDGSATGVQHALGEVTTSQPPAKPLTATTANLQAALMEAQRARRVEAVPLTEDERDRIVREARQRAGRQPAAPNAVQQADFEETDSTPANAPHTDAPPAGGLSLRNATPSIPQRHPLADESEARESTTSISAPGTDSAMSTEVPTDPRKTLSRRHPLDQPEPTRVVDERSRPDELPSAAPVRTSAAPTHELAPRCLGNRPITLARPEPAGEKLAGQPILAPSP
jgi:hypothetical protein